MWIDHTGQFSNEILLINSLLAHVSVHILKWFQSAHLTLSKKANTSINKNVKLFHYWLHLLWMKNLMKALFVLVRWIKLCHPSETSLSLLTACYLLVCQNVLVSSPYLLRNNVNYFSFGKTVKWIWQDKHFKWREWKVCL